MNDKEAQYLTTGFLIFVIIGIIFLGFIAGEDHANKKALDAGAAEWIINSKTGEKVFRYIKP